MLCGGKVMFNTSFMISFTSWPFFRSRTSWTHRSRTWKYSCNSDMWLLHKGDWSVSLVGSPSSNCCLLEIKQTRICLYRPQSCELAEGFNRTLTDILVKYCDKKMVDWDKNLPYLMSAYRATLNESTSRSPSLLMPGFEITFSIDLMYPPTDYHPYQYRVEYVEWIWWATQDNYELTRKNLKLQQKGKINILVNAPKEEISKKESEYSDSTHPICEINWSHLT